MLLFYLYVAENLVADASGDIKLIAECAKGEIFYLMCTYQCLTNLEFIFDNHGVSRWILGHLERERQGERQRESQKGTERER